MAGGSRPAVAQANGELIVPPGLSGWGISTSLVFMRTYYRGRGGYQWARALVHRNAGGLCCTSEMV